MASSSLHIVRARWDNSRSRLLGLRAGPDHWPGGVGYRDTGTDLEVVVGATTGPGEGDRGTWC